MRKYSRHNLKRISFVNNLYESMRRQQISNKNTRKSYLFATQLPPLMFDFFNLTSQPYSIWFRFTSLFQNFTRDITAKRSSSSSIALELAQESLSLFAKYNLLYSAILDSSQLLHYLSSAFVPIDIPDIPNAPATIECTFIYAILALVFHAASQSLTTTHQELAIKLEQYAAGYYRETIRRFWEMVFPAQKDTSLDRSTATLNLIRCAVLLTHYQCAAICEEQAYITLKMGVSIGQRYDFHSSSSSSSAENQVLFLVLHAWRSWFAFYLHREKELDEHYYPRAPSSISHQRWAVCALDAYTRFMNRLLTSNNISTISDVKVCFYSHRFALLMASPE